MREILRPSHPLQRGVARHTVLPLIFLQMNLPFALGASRIKCSGELLIRRTETRDPAVDDVLEPAIEADFLIDNRCCGACLYLHLDMCEQRRQFACEPFTQYRILDRRSIIGSLRTTRTSRWWIGRLVGEAGVVVIVGMTASVPISSTTNGGGACWIGCMAEVDGSCCTITVCCWICCGVWSGM